MPETDLLQGTLDLIVLRFARGPANGWDITQAIKQVVSKGGWR